MPTHDPIIVLADDLSGAAELAGIAFTHGLSAEVQREFEPDTNADIVAIDTDSRHLAPPAAAERLTAITTKILATNPAWIYKKVDSVLRGNVCAEIEAVIQVTGQSRVLLIPANPSRGRIVQSGRYLIDGIPLDQTHFARDPDHPQTSSDVTTLLGSEGNQTIHPISADEPLPGTGIIVPDVSSTDDLFRRGIAADTNTLLAGAADFFATLLHQRFARQQVPPLPPRISPPSLLVCGSRLAWPTRRRQCEAAGIPVVAIASGFGTGPSDFRNLLFGIDESERADSGLLLSFLARFTKSLIEHSSPKTLLAEGGATAAAIAAEMKWTRFQVVATAPAGVAVLRPHAPSAPLFLIKPGSYAWPPEIWQVFCRC